MRIIFGFPTDPRKINELIQTVDQEVGGSNRVGRRMMVRWFLR